MKHKTHNIKHIKKEEHKNCSMCYAPCFMKQKGVTLIELVVVLAVFMLIMGVTISIFISILQRQKSILGEQELLNQMSYAIEYMSRPIRTAQKDTTGSCLPSSGYIYFLTHYDSVAGSYGGIKFITKDNVCQEFFLTDNGILKEIKNGQASQNILSRKFKIKYVRFIINGNKSLKIASQNDSVQPRITMVLDVQTPTDSGQQEKIIQTTISNVNLNI